MPWLPGAGRGRWSQHHLGPGLRDQEAVGVGCEIGLRLGLGLCPSGTVYIPYLLFSWN